MIFIIILGVSCENIQKNIEERLNKEVDNQIDMIDSTIHKTVNKTDSIINKSTKTIEKEQIKK